MTAKVETIRNPAFGTLTYRVALDSPVPDPWGTADGVAVEFWYDRQSRNWITYLVDKDGHQTGAAEFGYDRADALLSVEYLAGLDRVPHVR